MSSPWWSLPHLLTSSLPQHEAPSGQHDLLQDNTVHQDPPSARTSSKNNLVGKTLKNKSLTSILGVAETRAQALPQVMTPKCLRPESLRPIQRWWTALAHQLRVWRKTRATPLPQDQKAHHQAKNAVKKAVRALQRVFYAAGRHFRSHGTYFVWPNLSTQLYITPLLIDPSSSHLRTHVGSRPSWDRSVFSTVFSTIQVDTLYSVQCEQPPSIAESARVLASRCKTTGRIESATPRRSKGSLGRGERVNIATRGQLRAWPQIGAESQDWCWIDGPPYAGLDGAPLCTVHGSWLRFQGSVMDEDSIRKKVLKQPRPLRKIWLRSILSVWGWHWISKCAIKLYNWDVLIVNCAVVRLDFSLVPVALQAIVTLLVSFHEFFALISGHFAHHPS